MAGFGQYIQNLRQFQDLSDMGMNNTGIPNTWQQNFRNINPVDYFSVQQQQQQQMQLEFPAASYSCDHNNYLSTSAPGDTGVATNNEESVTTTSIMYSKNCSSASTCEIGGDMINKKNKRIGKGKKGRSMNGRSEEVIHVRAKRGQATDSHSIAERVRREKINKKMRYLQDLVPGCHKTMGMAGMLEEIINYVHSLQNQVEFLSMELAAACSNKKAQGTNNSQETTTEMEKWARARAREQYGDYYACFPSTWSL